MIFTTRNSLVFSTSLTANYPYTDRACKNEPTTPCMQATDDVKPAAPIFLICSERSGSNLISSIVGEHPRVFAHPPYHLGRDLIMRLHDVAAAGVASPAWQVLKDNAVARVAKYRGDEEAAGLQGFLDAQSTISPHAIARFVYQQMPKDARGKHAFVKENNAHQMLLFLVDCFPDAKFIFQVRDPRDYLLSAVARRKRWLGNKFGSVRNAMHVWRDDQLGGLAAYGLLGRERVFLQRYEDLVAHFEETTSALCEFLGLDFDQRMRNFHEAEHAQSLAVKGGPRENLARPLMTANFRKYREGLSRGRIKMVEAYVGDLMDRFGYPREFTGLMRPSFVSVLRSNLSEPLERIINSDFGAQYKAGNRRLQAKLDAEVTPLCPPLWE